jgi:transposase, IS605 orfB family
MAENTSQETLALTLKLKILPESQNQVTAFKQTMATYKDACNIVSQYIFDNIPEAAETKTMSSLLSAINLQKTAMINGERIYDILTKQLRLPSQVTCEVFRSVISNYKTIQTVLKKQTVAGGYQYDDEGNILLYEKGKHKGEPKLAYIYKDLTFLQKPLCYKKPQLILSAGRSYSFIKDFSKASISVINDRIKLPFKLTAKQKELFTNPDWKRGNARLVHTGNKWFLHVSFTKNVSKPDIVAFNNIIGIDAGLRQIMTIYNAKTGQTFFEKGQAIAKKRRNYAKKRQSLQSKNTKSAKRRLKKLSGRENRWMTDVNHCLSKTLVFENPNTLIVVEDLTNVTFDTVSHRKKENRYEHHSWAFYQLQQDIAYKAREHGSYLIKVNPAYTSQRCPKCGTICKENRDKTNHIYHCNNCHYQSNDDRVAAMNIVQLGQMKQKGVKKPSFKTYN